jgi:hypothetical protein
VPAKLDRIDFQFALVLQQQGALPGFRDICLKSGNIA